MLTIWFTMLIVRRIKNIKKHKNSQELSKLAKNESFDNSRYILM